VALVPVSSLLVFSLVRKGRRLLLGSPSVVAVCGTVKGGEGGVEVDAKLRALLVKVHGGVGGCASLFMSRSTCNGGGHDGTDNDEDSDIDLEEWRVLRALLSLGTYAGGSDGSGGQLMSLPGISGLEEEEEDEEEEAGTGTG
jgi:hypothetical protein